MKVIDLLNIIANGDDVPEYVRYFNKLDGQYLVMLPCKDNIIYRLNEGAIDLNDEIIKEDKKDNFTGIKYYSNGEVFMSVDTSEKLQPENVETNIEKLNKNHFHKKQRQLANKINELIDEVNKLKEEK